MRPAKETPRRGFQSLVSTLALLFTSLHLFTYGHLFLFLVPTEIRSCNCKLARSLWYARRGGGEGRKEEEGRGENGNVSQTMLDVQRCC